MRKNIPKMQKKKNVTGGRKRIVHLTGVEHEAYSSSVLIIKIKIKTVN